MFEFWCLLVINRNFGLLFFTFRWDSDQKRASTLANDDFIFITFQGWKISTAFEIKFINKLLIITYYILQNPKLDDFTTIAKVPSKNCRASWTKSAKLIGPSCSRYRKFKRFEMHSESVSVSNSNPFDVKNFLRALSFEMTPLWITVKSDEFSPSFQKFQTIRKFI